MTATPTLKIQSRVGAAATGLAASGATSISSSCAPAMSLTDRSAVRSIRIYFGAIVQCCKGATSPRSWGLMESREDCLREAAECDRLAQLANTQGTRTLLAVAAFQWRKLAERAAERQKRSWPLMPDAVRMN